MYIKLSFARALSIEIRRSLVVSLWKITHKSIIKIKFNDRLRTFFSKRFNYHDYAYSLKCMSYFIIPSYSANILCSFIFTFWSYYPSTKPSSLGLPPLDVFYNTNETRESADPNAWQWVLPISAFL